MNNAQDTIQIKGEITITKRQVPNFLIPLERLGFYKIVNQLSPIVSVKKYHNLVCIAGKSTIVNRWAGNTTKSGVLTYLAIGDSTTAPTVNDTKLGDEFFRKTITSATVSGTTCHTSTYIATNEGNGTYAEIGLFGDDASSTKDSGTLYTHASINESKSSGVSLTIDYDLSIT